MKKNTLSYIKLFFTIYILIISFSFTALSEEIKNDKHGSKGKNPENIKKGKRLFNGLIVTGENTLDCASCHNTMVIDTFNWNPSALEIALSTKDMDSTTFSNLILNPVTKRMSEVHKDTDLSGEQVVLIREYLETFESEGLYEHKILATKLIFFIFLVVVFLAAFIDLTFTKFIRFKVVHGLVMVTALGFIVNIIVRDAIGLGRSQGYAPLQPIKFSHKVHVTDNKIDCLYCHHTVETAKSAGIPSTNVCLNCHELVREGTNSGRFEINKIITNAENKKATEWVRIHKLPDHVFFSHAQHVGVGKLDCAECHGPVEESHLVEQYSDLSMGWCLDCHRTEKVNFTENEYYEKTFEEYHEQFKNKLIDSVTVADLGGQDCMKCHY